MMKEKSFTNKQKNTDNKNTEMKTPYASQPTSTNQQPEPQPKDYNEIEY
ncbi:hypothetical protein ACFDTO_30410 [Microbacteriaceae bacterium 4G12]